MIPVDILGIHVDPHSGAPIVLLAEVNEVTRVLPIFVGPAEAAAIAIGLQGIELPRPGTHDLLLDIVSTLDAEVIEVEVTALEGGTFLAEVELEVDGVRRRVSSRPSDGIALACRLGAPVYVNAGVLDEASVEVVHDTETPFEEEEIEQIMTDFSEFLQTAAPSDFVDPDAPDAPDSPE